MVISAIDALHELHHEHHVPQIPHQVTNNCNAKNTLHLEPYLQMFRSRHNQTLTADDLSQLINNFHGLKFIPTDVEMLYHLRSKCGFSEPHVFLDYFVPTLEEGSCAMHPKDLPGIKEEGSYYFHKMEQAVSSEKKRKRMIPFQWRKSGRPVMISDNGGCEMGMKIISVLYDAKKNLRWVRHEYLLLSSGKQTVGDFALWKIFFPTKKTQPDNPPSTQPISNPPSAQPISPISNPSYSHPNPVILELDSWQSVHDNANTYNLDFLGDYSLDFLADINYDDINDN